MTVLRGGAGLGTPPGQAAASSPESRLLGPLVAGLGKPPLFLLAAWRAEAFGLPTPCRVGNRLVMSDLAVEQISNVCSGQRPVTPALGVEYESFNEPFTGLRTRERECPVQVPSSVGLTPPPSSLDDLLHGAAGDPGLRRLGGPGR